MNLHHYQTLAARTEKPLDKPAALQHGCLGLATEVGELTDAVKKHVIYGKELDVCNLQEEIGDILWYLAVVANNAGISMSAAAGQNIEKLQQRYPEKYSDADALERKDKV